MNENKKILEIKNLEKYFINNNNIIRAIDNVSFDLKKGEIIGLIGESGSGKSTIAKSIIRLINDYFGNIIINKIDVSGKKIPKKIRKYLTSNVQMIFQDPYSSLNEKMNIFSILKEAYVATGQFKSDFNEFMKKFSETKRIFKNELQIFHSKIIYEIQKFKLENLSEFYKHLKKDVYNFQIDSNNIKKIKEELDIFVAMTFQKKFNYNEKIVTNISDALDKIIKKYLSFQTKLNINDLGNEEKFLQNAIEKYNQIANFEKFVFDDNKNIYHQIKKSKDKIIILENEKKRIINNQIIKHKVIIQKLINEINFSRDYRYTDKKYKIIAIEKNKIKTLKKYKNLIWNIDKKSLLLAINQLEKTKLNQEMNDIFHKNFSYKIINKSSKYYINNQNILNLKKQVLSNYQSIYKNFKNIDGVKNIDFLIIKTKELLEFNFKQIFETRINSKSIFWLELKNNFIIQKNIFLINLQIKKIIKKIKTKNKEKINQAKIHFINDSLEYEKKINAWLAKQNLDMINNQRKQEIEKLNHDYFKIKSEANILFNNKILQIKTYIKKIIKNIENNIFLDEKTQSLFNEKKLLHNSLEKLENDRQQKYYQIKKQIKKNFQKIHKSKNKFKRKYQDILNEFNSKIKKDNLNNEAFEIEYNLLNKDLKNASELTINNYKFLITNYKIKKLILKKAIKKILINVGLKAEHAYRYPHEFSGGQRQRIAIARALIGKPKIIIADEPIAALDISIQAQVVNMLKKLTLENNVSMIFIAHDLSMVEYIADKLQILHLGKIVERGQTSKIFANPCHPYTKQLFDAIPKISTSNRKFIARSFDETYLKELKLNFHKYYKVSDDHEILATKNQFEKWTSLKK